MLDAQTLIKMGFQGKRIGELIKLSKNWNQEQLKSFLETGQTPIFEKTTIVDGSVLQWMCEKSDFFPASSNSEKRRMLEQSSVIINGLSKSPDDLVPPIVHSLILFPGSKVKKCTML